MKKINYKIIIILIVIFFTTGCEDILDKAPVSSLTFESFWSSKDDFDAGLTAAYSLTQTGLSATTNNVFLWGDGRADGVTNHTGVGLAYNAISAGDIYGVDWTNLYRMVNQANLVIRYADNSDILNDTQKSQIMGEAYFLRALGYFYLVRIWGYVPLLTEGYDSSSQELYPRNDDDNQIEMVLAQVKGDVDQAVNLLNFSSNRDLATRAAALALRADYNLWVGWENSDNTAFQSVVDDVNQILNNGSVTYSLVDNFTSIFGTSVTSEDVFVLKFGDITDPNNSLAEVWASYEIVVSDEDKAKGIYIPYGSPNNSGGYGRYNVSEKLVNLFDELDQRKDATFAQQVFENEPSHGLPVYWCRKFIGGTSYSSPVISARIDHMRLYRTAGILLMQAEAYVKLNKLDEAMNIVNTIRQRAYGDNYEASIHAVSDITSTDEMLDIVLDEGFKELAWEGKRWFDLVRTKKALIEKRDRLSATGEERPIAEVEGELLWPISVGSLTQNSNLVQNEFYR